MTTKSPVPAGALDGVQPRRALAQAVDLGADRLVVDLRLALADLDALVVAELGLRAHADLDREAQRLALAPGRSPRSSSGSPTGAIRAASIAAVYQAPIESRTASSRTASRPMRWTITGGGALPARKPGTRMLATEPAGGLRDAALDLLGGHLRLHAHARLGELGDGGDDVGGHGRATTIQSGVVRSLRAWLYTGPLGHLAAGIADWLELLARYARSRARKRLP